MSADNWAICPRCLARARADYATEERRVAQMYGVAPIDEFDAARAALVPVNPDDFRTFREDYEFYLDADSAVWGMSYRGCCTACDLRHDVADETTLELGS